jgi:LacI family transcriptional regulator
VGFDDFERSELMPRPLTVIGYDVQEFGRTPAAKPFARVDGEESWPNAVSAAPDRPARPATSLVADHELHAGV